MKDVMTGLEKVEYLLGLIDDKRAVQSSDTVIVIDSFELDNAINPLEVESILSKLKSDENILYYDVSTSKGTTFGLDSTLPHRLVITFKIKTLDTYDAYRNIARQHSTSVKHYYLSYNNELGEVTYDGSTRRLFLPNTLEGRILELVIVAQGSAVTSLEVSDKYDEASLGLKIKALVSAKDRINKKLYEAFNCDDVVIYSSERFWLNKTFVISE